MKTEQRLQQEIALARSKLNKIESARRAKENRKFVGKCFKYQNSYGHGDPWLLYLRVTGGGYWLKGYKFERTSTGRFEANFDECVSCIDGYEEISRKEFDKAWRKFLAGLKALNNL